MRASLELKVVREEIKKLSKDIDCYGCKVVDKGLICFDTFATDFTISPIKKGQKKLSKVIEEWEMATTLPDLMDYLKDKETNYGKLRS